MYIGKVGNRMELSLTLKKRFEFSSNFGYMPQTMYIYSFEDKDGNVYIWKTSTIIGMDKEVPIKGGDTRIEFDFVNNGDSISVKATIKEHSEYKGTEQTVLSRVKVTSISHIPTKEEIQRNKREEQMKSLSEGDFIWNMPYKQFKEHYSDCETLAGSFEYIGGVGMIDVIIRNGRLVNSGVRGKHFKGFEFTVDGKTVCYRAVSEENARNRCVADFPTAVSIECTKIYSHRGRF